MKISYFVRFWTDLTRFLPILDVDGPILRVFDPILAENIQNQGVKSKNKFCLIKYLFRITAPTLLVMTGLPGFHRCQSRLQDPRARAAVFLSHCCCERWTATPRPRQNDFCHDLVDTHPLLGVNVSMIYQMNSCVIYLKVPTINLGPFPPIYVQSK